jgi:hypothetical protein
VTPHELPELLQRAMAILFVGIGIGLVVAHTLLVTLASQRTTLAPRTRLAIAGIVGVYLIAWLGVAITFGDQNNFPLDRENLRLPLSLVVAFGPQLLAILGLFLWKPLRQVNAAMPRTWLIWVQIDRVAGFIFLFYLYYGILPASFAIPAAVGDVLTGVTTPFVALALARRRRHAVTWATAWNLFGILDMIVAPAAAFLSRAAVIGMYPLNLVPLFIGPPISILAHVYSIRNLHVAASSVAPGGVSTSFERPRSQENALGTT